MGVEQATLFGSRRLHVDATLGTTVKIKTDSRLSPIMFEATAAQGSSSMDSTCGDKVVRRRKAAEVIDEGRVWKMKTCL